MCVCVCESVCIKLNASKTTKRRSGPAPSQAPPPAAACGKQFLGQIERTTAVQSCLFFIFKHSQVCH